MAGRTKWTLIGAWKGWRTRVEIWSIGVYEGATPFALEPASGTSGPVLRARDVTDVAARFVADPFMVQDGARWVMFMEVFNAERGKGEIAVATSGDGVSWRYDQVVLSEPFHLSYPYVFRWQGAWYMIPESHEAGSVRLYRALEFPHRWSFERTLIERPYTDCSVVQAGGRWWLFAAGGPREPGVLRLHHAEALEAPWSEHPASPIVAGDQSRSRPGGRLIRYEGRLYRIAQDGVPSYGSRLHAFEITTLTTTDYQEREIPGNPILAGSGSGWNRAGMHHIDAHQCADGRWIAVVDGHRWVRELTTDWSVRARLEAIRRAKRRVPAEAPAEERAPAVAAIVVRSAR
jgi:hypothetical protein